MMGDLLPRFPGPTQQAVVVVPVRQGGTVSLGLLVTVESAFKKTFQVCLHITVAVAVVGVGHQGRHSGLVGLVAVAMAGVIPDP